MYTAVLFQSTIAIQLLTTISQCPLDKRSVAEMDTFIIVVNILVKFNADVYGYGFESKQIVGSGVKNNFLLKE